MSDGRVNFLNEINSFVVESKSYLSNLLSKINWPEDKLLTGDNSDELLRERGTSSDFRVDTPINYNIKESNGGINKVYGGTVDVLPQPVKRDKEETLLDILARERDLKRRRIGYKGRIHTKHKSHHEILREVIAQQMEAIEDTISGDLSTCPSQIDDHINSTKEESVKIIDISQMNVNNPHLTWKYVANQLNLIKDEDKSDKYIKEKMSRSKSELHNDEDSKSDKSYHKYSKDKYYEGMYRLNREKKDISYIDSRNTSKEKLTNSSKSKTHHENLDGNHSNVYRRKSDKDSYPRQKQDISHHGDNRYTDKRNGKSFRSDYQEDNDINSDDSYQNKDCNLDKGLSNINRKEDYREGNEEDDLKTRSSKSKRNRDGCKKHGDKDDQDRNKGDRDKSKDDRYIDRRKKDQDECKKDRYIDRNKKYWDDSNEDRYIDRSKKEKDHDTTKDDRCMNRSSMYCDKTQEGVDRRNEYGCIDRSKNKKDHGKSKEASDKSNEDHGKHNEETRKRDKDRHSKKSKKRRRSRDKSCEIPERSKKKKKKSRSR